MPLSKSKLQSQLAAAFSSYPKTTLEASQKIADALVQYSMDATFGTSLPTGLGAKKPAIVAGMNAAFASKTPAGFVNAMVNAVTLLWTGTPVAGASGTGATVITGAAAMSAPLTALMASYEASTASFAQKLAAIIHTAVKTTMAPLTIPPSAPVPTPIA